MNDVSFKLSIAFPISGIGSLPMLDFDTAATKVVSLCPDFPYVPELPQKGRFYHMLLDGFRDYEEFFDAKSALTAPSIEKGKLEDFFDALKDQDLNLNDFCAGEIALKKAIKNQGVAPSAVKFQSIGPFTLLRCLRHGGTPLEVDEDYWVPVIEHIAGNILKKAKIFEEIDLSTYCYFDEPMLGMTVLRHAGRTGSICRMYGLLKKFLQNSNIRFGIHCCGAFPAERILEIDDAFPLQGLSAPMSVMQDNGFKEVFESILKKGKDSQLLLGVVETNPTETKIPADLAFERVSSWIKAYKDSLSAYYSSIVLTPVCGLGLLAEDAIESIFFELTKIAGDLRSGLSEINRG